MRQGELINGIGLVDENGNKVTESKLAAAKGISQVVFSRIFMALPGMSKYLSFFFVFTGFYKIDVDYNYCLNYYFSNYSYNNGKNSKQTLGSKIPEPSWTYTNFGRRIFVSVIGCAKFESSSKNNLKICQFFLSQPI